MKSSLKKAKRAFFIFLLILSGTAAALGSPVPDTGQTKCYDNEKAISCPNPGEAFYGQDGNYNINPINSINPPSYTKLNAQGNDLADNAAEWVMVRDNITGLIWEVKQAKDGNPDYSNPHDADNTYTWYDSNSETNGGNAGTPGDGTDTEDFINALNADKFGGFSDWRVPDIKELVSIMSFGKSGAAINSKYFIHMITVDANYWSSDTSPDKSDRALSVHSFYGNDNKREKDKDYENYVIACCSGETAAGFVYNDDNTTTDTATGLMWQKQPHDSAMNWKEALSYCEELSLAGYDDWRLPNIKELRSIVNYKRYDPAVTSDYFSAQSVWYWSSTSHPDASRNGDASCIDFKDGTDYAKDGDTENDMKLSEYYVRCVRGGQNRLPDHLFISVPAQGSKYNPEDSITITWDIQDVADNVKISVSRQGGKAETFETIAETTENDGIYNWNVTSPDSVNCMMKIEPLNDPSKGTAQGLFTITSDKTTITCELSEYSIIIGEPLRVSGKITPHPFSNVSADIVLAPPSGLGESIRKPVVVSSITGDLDRYDLGCGDIFAAGTWTAQISWNNDGEIISSEPLSLQVSKAKSRVKLDATSRSVKIGEKISLSGRFVSQPYCDKILPGTQIALKITDPDGTLSEEILDADASGFFKLEYYEGFGKLGDWTVQAVFEGNGAYEGSESEVLEISVVETAGYAIIIQGRNSYGEGIRPHAKTTGFVYDTLINRGLAADDIRYFSYDTSRPDICETPSKNEIEKAFTEWARDKMNSETGKAANLYIVMVDHGLNDRFSLHPDIITPEYIDGWLDRLQENLTRQAADQEIIVILGFCHSGSFIEKLAGDHRIIIASAAPGESSFKGPLDEGDVRDGEFFISEFFKSVSYGKSVRECFRDAVKLTEKFTSALPANSLSPPYFDRSRQHPLLEDDGKEPFGSNDLSNPSGDGAFSKDIFIGVSSITANDPGDVTIEEVSDAQFLNEEDISVNLWARADDFSRVSTVWCEVKPPDYTLTNLADTDEQAEMNLAKTLYTSHDGKNQFLWTDLGKEPDHPDFSPPGTYQVFFFAKDNETGNISPLRETRVYKAKAGNQPPDSFSLISPPDAKENDATVSTTPLLDWEDAEDPDGDRVSYTVIISEVEDFSEAIYKEGLENSVCLILPSDGLSDGKSYYWKVLAIDEYGEIRESDIRLFRTDNYDNPPDGWIRGYVYNVSTENPVSEFEVAVGDSIIKANSGYYLGEKSPGPYSVSVKAEGYEDSATVEVYIPEGDTVTKNFGLIPVAVDVDISGDGKTDLADVILGLQILSGTAKSSNKADVDGDAKVGLADVIYVMRYLPHL